MRKDFHITNIIETKTTITTKNKLAVDKMNFMLGKERTLFTLHMIFAHSPNLANVYIF